MAGLIDVGILKPELAGSFAAGYRGAEQERQRSARAEQQLVSGRQQIQMDELTMKRLQEDRVAMLDLQERLKAAGKDPDLEKVFDVLATSGNPQYVLQGIEGKRRLQEQREFARIQGLSMPGVAPEAAPTVAPGAAVPPAPVNALVAGPDQTPAETNRLLGAAPPVAPVNALVPTPGVGAPAPAPMGQNPALIAQTQDRINNLMRFAATASPQMANNAMAQARILQDQLEMMSRRGPNEPAALQELRAYLAMSPEEKAAFERLQKIKSPSVTATATTTTPVAKSLAAEVGQRADTSRVKAEGAAGIMESANMVREALNTGNVIAGPLAGVRTKFAQVLELAGAGDKEKLVATRTAIQGLATLTLESRAELKGQGQVTENEQKLLERARSGSIEDMTIAELQQIVNVSQRLANRLWSSHQALLKTMESDPAAADSIRYYRPTMALPQPIGEGAPKGQSDARRKELGTIFGAPPQQPR